MLIYSIYTRGANQRKLCVTDAVLESSGPSADEKRERVAALKREFGTTRVTVREVSEARAAHSIAWLERLDHTIHDRRA